MSKLKLLNQQMQETWVGSLGWKESLKKRMAIHSSILAGESHGQETWQAMGSERVVHDQVTNTHASIVYTVNPKFPMHATTMPFPFGIHTFVPYVCVSISAL